MNLLRRHVLDAFLIVGAVAVAAGLALSDQRLRFVAAVFGAASLLVLLARRRQPLVASIASFAFLGGSFAAAPDSPNVQFFSTMATFAIVAAINTTRDGIIAGIVGAFVVAVIDVSTDPGSWVGDLTLTLGFCLVMWVAGWLVSRHTRRADLMALRAQTAEAQRASAVRDERARLARELHDVVSHGLSVVVLQTMAARTSLSDGDAPGLERHLDSVESTARDALAEMRRMLDLLQVDDLDEARWASPSPGLAQLPALIERARDAGVDVSEVRLGVESAPATGSAMQPLPAGVELAVYRVVQEALTNAAKHAVGAHVSVDVRRTDGQVAVDIVDDGGRGSGARLDGAGRGLIGMRERVALYGGHIDTGPRPDGGFRVVATLPVAAANIPEALVR